MGAFLFSFLLGSFPAPHVGGEGRMGNMNNDDALVGGFIGNCTGDGDGGGGGDGDDVEMVGRSGYVCGDCGVLLLLRLLLLQLLAARLFQY